MKIFNNQRFLFVSRDQRKFTHGIHKYPAKFFPELPRWLIHRYSKKGETVLDPFMGSGTTNLEASILGRHSIGIDVDPFSRYLAKVKTTVLNSQKLEHAHNLLLQRLKKYDGHNAPKRIPDFPYRDNWFKPHVLRELAYINHLIDSSRTSNNIKDFFRICMSSVIRNVSEADNNCTRTVIRKKLKKQVNEKMAIDLFSKRLALQVNNMKELANIKPKGKVIITKKDDARRMPSISDDSIELALTSPPYLNAVDYPRTHQLELYWLEIANGSLQPLKRKHVGTEAVTVNEYRMLQKTGCKSADDVIKRIYDKDPRRAYIATKYIWDMQDNLLEVQRVLKPGGHYVIVVGNNSVAGEHFETWRYLRLYAKKIGFNVKYNIISEIINHHIKVPRKERINDDHILVFQK